MHAIIIYLSLAGASGDTTALGAGDLAAGDCSSNDVWVGDRGLRHAAERLASTGYLAILLIGSKVERDEQHQVRGENTHSRESSEFLSSALAGIGHRVEVGRGEVGVGRKVDEAKIDDELDDLESGNPLLPPDTNTSGALEVVPVHDDVNGQVQADDNPRDRCVSNQLGVAKDGGRTMVVAVEER